MSLSLIDRMHDAGVATGVQMSLGYDPHPPYDAGGPLEGSIGDRRLRTCRARRGAGRAPAASA